MKPIALAFGVLVMSRSAIACNSTSGDVLDARDSGVLESGAPDVGFDGTVDASDGGDSGDAGCPDAALESDPSNCGRCAHDCQRGACVQGACQPVLLWNVAKPFAVHVDDTRVYWTTPGDPGEIGSVGKDGTDPRILASGLHVPQGVFADSSNVFWTELLGGRLWRADKDGANAVVMNDRGATGAFSVVADATSVYWVDYYQSPSIRKLLRGATLDAGVPVALASNQRYPFGIAQDANNVYWSDREDSYLGPIPDGGIPGRIWMAAKDGSGAPTLLATGQANPYCIAVDATNVYWVNNGSDSVMQLRFGDTIPIEILHVRAPFGIAIDGAYVYVTSFGTDQGDGLLTRVSKGGGAAVVMASSLPHPTHVAVDDTAAYWGNHYGGTVMKIAK